MATLSTRTILVFMMEFGGDFRTVVIDPGDGLDPGNESKVMPVSWLSFDDIDESR